MKPNIIHYMDKTGKLYIVATPIGNPRDITLRALDVLKAVDGIICEERREGSTLLKRLDVLEKSLITLNEHNETEATADLVIRMFKGESFALISDAGTPVFADPGAYLIQEASLSGLQVVPIPGPSSLMAILSVLDFKLDKFVFGGFLSRIPEQRRQELTQLRGLRLPVVLMDTPYRLAPLLDDVEKTFGRGQRLTLGFDLTQDSEIILRGTPSEVKKALGPRKGEFMLIVHGQMS
ncbi:MAG TPA: SAM-dependent methyltransferase [Bellilinea sp.]|nr:SAM-dependent methyltransferase [Bellilinea sp.]